jgi:hypothetical protein
MMTNVSVGQPENGRDVRVRDLARAVVKDVAPQELQYFDVLCRRYFVNPERTLRPSPRDSPAGSGLEVLVHPVTPIIVAALTSMLSDELKIGFTALVKRLKRRRSRGIKLPGSGGTGSEATLDQPLTPSQELAQDVAARVDELASALELSADTTQALRLRVEIVMSDPSATRLAEPESNSGPEQG